MAARDGQPLAALPRLVDAAALVVAWAAGDVNREHFLDAVYCARAEARIVLPIFLHTFDLHRYVLGPASLLHRVEYALLDLGRDLGGTLLRGGLVRGTHRFFHRCRAGGCRRLRLRFVTAAS